MRASKAGPQKSVGVEGTGATGMIGKGLKGPGVEGTGAVGDSIAEPGMIGRGARRPDENNPQQLAHGPGVVGIGGDGIIDEDGDIDEPMNLGRRKSTIGSAGVVGFGANFKVHKAADGQVHGPRFPGSGVVGVGGTRKPPDGDDSPTFTAPGVVGLSGQQPGPPGDRDLGDIGDVGVFGSGATGIVGIGHRRMTGDGIGVVGRGSRVTRAGGGDAGIAPGVVGHGGTRESFDTPGFVESAAGVIGLSNGVSLSEPGVTGATGVFGSGINGITGVGTTGRGGVFESLTDTPQIRLMPNRGPDLPTQIPYTPQIVDDPVSMQLPLPANGRSGDLMAVYEGGSRCRLWFCVNGNSERGAKWAEVLLGPEFDGTA